MNETEKSYFEWRETIMNRFVQVARLIDKFGVENILADSRRRRFELKDTEQTYRAINHWCKIGLIDDNRTNTQGWRKFSMVELALIAIISELRNFGVPLKTIKIVKEELFKAPITENYDNPNKVRWIEYACVCSGRIPNYGNTFLILSNDKKIYLSCSFTLQDQSMLDDLPSTYLLINLNKLLSRVSPCNFREAGVNILIINNKILEILKATQDDNIEKVTINKKGKEVDSIEKVYSTDKSKIHELVESVGYGEINLIPLSIC